MSTKTMISRLTERVEVYYFCQSVEMWIYWFSAVDVDSAMRTISQLSGTA